MSDLLPETEARREVRGWGWLDALHPEDRERTAQVWRQAVQTQNLYTAEYRVRAKDGSYSHRGGFGNCQENSGKPRWYCLARISGRQGRDIPLHLT